MHSGTELDAAAGQASTGSMLECMLSGPVWLTGPPAKTKPAPMFLSWCMLLCENELGHLAVWLHGGTIEDAAQPFQLAGVVRDVRLGERKVLGLLIRIAVGQCRQTLLSSVSWHTGLQCKMPGDQTPAQLAEYRPF